MGEAAQGRYTLNFRYAPQTREELRRVVNETLWNRSRNWAICVAGGMAAIGIVIWVYRQETKEAVATELSDVASRSLGDQRMQQQAQLVTIQTLQALLEHEETIQRSVAFLSAVSESPQTRAALIELLVDALKSRPVINEALELVLWVLNDERARDNVASLLLAALYNERFIEGAGEWVVRFLERGDVRAAVAGALHEGSKQALQEPDLQAKTSEHMWGALRGLISRRRPIAEIKRRESSPPRAAPTLQAAPAAPAATQLLPATASPFATAATAPATSTSTSPSTSVTSTETTPTAADAKPLAGAASPATAPAATAIATIATASAAPTTATPPQATPSSTGADTIFFTGAEAASSARLQQAAIANTLSTTDARAETPTDGALPPFHAAEIVGLSHTARGEGSLLQSPSNGATGEHTASSRSNGGGSKPSHAHPSARPSTAHDAPSVGSADGAARSPSTDGVPGP